MDLGISGRTAAVAASSKGLGFASAKALAEEGVRVAICGRDRERIEAAAREIDAIPLVADLSTTGGATGFMKAATEALGQIDILVANNGGPPPGSALGSDLDAYRQAIELNLLSTIALCQAAVPGMCSRRWGRVVAITSIGAVSPIPVLAASSTARTGLSGYLKALASEVAKDGVTVNSAQPGMHATDRVKALGATSTKGIPTGELGRPEDFGRAVAFLCSDAARFITGTRLLIDGGAFSGL